MWTNKLNMLWKQFKENWDINMSDLFAKHERILRETARDAGIDTDGDPEYPYICVDIENLGLFVYGIPFEIPSEANWSNDDVTKAILNDNDFLNQAEIGKTYTWHAYIIEDEEDQRVVDGGSFLSPAASDSFVYEG